MVSHEAFAHEVNDRWAEKRTWQCLERLRATGRPPVFWDTLKQRGNTVLLESKPLKQLPEASRKGIEIKCESHGNSLDTFGCGFGLLGGGITEVPAADPADRAGSAGRAARPPGHSSGHTESVVTEERPRLTQTPKHFGRTSMISLPGSSVRDRT